MRTIVEGLVIGLLSLLPLLASAHEEAPRQVRILLDQPLLDAPGKRGVLHTVHFAPGQVSAPHVHGGSVLAYVLEGTVVTQQEGGPVQSFKAGESWYETPGVPHVQARNGSDKVPAMLLVWQLLPTGEPVAKPLQ
ncbi:MAG: cupin domain-containing protein [Pseudomonas sp.]